MQSQVERSRAMVEYCRVQQNDGEQRQSDVESGRVKQSHGRVIESSRVEQSHGRVMYSKVERSRAMIELRKVKYSEVEPGQSYEESSRVKKSHGRVM